MSTLSEQINHFLNHIHNERGLADNTSESYQHDLKILLGYAEDINLNQAQDFTANHIRQLIGQSHRKGMSGRSQQRRLSAFRTFFNFIAREEVLSQNPAQLVTAPKGARKLPRTLDTDQVSQLLNFVPEDWHGYRDKAILELLYSSGLRLSELTNADCDSISLSEETIRVTGKGNKQRIVPVGSLAMQALRDWMLVRKNLPVKRKQVHANALFISQAGSRISPSSIQARLRYWAKKQHLVNNLHPHMLRHSFASHVLESSGDLRAVQELLGHADISTTQIYTHLDFQHLAAVYDKTHPRAQRKKTSEPT